MCFGALFGISNNKKRKSSSSGEKKRRERPSIEPLHGDGVPVVAEVQEKRRSSERHRRKKSQQSPRREREEHRPRQQYQEAYRSRAQYRAPLHLDVPNMWYRSVDPESTNSSEEMLLNPRPQRSRQQRQKHKSQTTLRGRGAPRKKSTKTMRPEVPPWSIFAPSSPKTPKKRDHHSYQTLESSPRSHRSPRQHRSSHYQDTPESSRSQQRHSRSRQQQPHSRSTRHATPNTAVRRDPDRRFAVLAATNTALEELRREAFAQPSPPPRRDRLRRYQGVTIPASSIPYSWDCVSSSQTSAGYGEPSTRQRRRR